MSEAVAVLANMADGLIKTYGDSSYQEELTSARDEYCERRGRVFEDEEHWEVFTRGFLEWYVVERPLTDAGPCPALLATETENDEVKLSALRALASSQRSLVEIVGLGKGVVEVVDLIGGARFSVAEGRSLLGMNRGDIAEVRLIGFQEQVWFGRLFLDHPPGTQAAIVDRVARMRAKGMSRAEVIDHLALLRSRSRNYKHVSAVRIYENDGDLSGAS